MAESRLVFFFFAETLSSWLCSMEKQKEAQNDETSDRGDVLQEAKYMEGILPFLAREFISVYNFYNFSW